MELTEMQQLCVDTRDRTLLVSAAAGSGKTSTLTQRIIASLLDENNPGDLTRMLIVTFTNAATADLKAKIEEALTNALKAHPNNARLERQLNLLPTATIKTIDAYCNDVLKNTAESVGLPVGYRVPDLAEIMLLRQSVSTTVIEGFYNGDFGSVMTKQDFYDLTESLTKNRSDTDLEKCLMYVYEKTQSHELGIKSLEKLIEKFNIDKNAPIESTEFGKSIMNAVQRYAMHCKGVYGYLEKEMADLGLEKYAAACVTFADEMQNIADASTYQELYERKQQKSPSWPKNTAKDPTVDAFKDNIYTPTREKANKFFNEYLTYSEAELKEAFKGLYKMTRNLYTVLEKFDFLYREEKKRLGLCEYADMEYYTYNALYNEDGTASEFAESVRQSYDAVYIDEYQDVNRLQSKIFDAISTKTNRFMVGDVKQSIYSFRNADPTIFLGLKKELSSKKKEEQTEAMPVFMSENFRCDKPIIDYVNEVFDVLFSYAKDSIDYQKEDRLNFAKRYDDGVDVPKRNVEIIHVETNLPPVDTEEESEKMAVSKNRAEAHAVALKIKELMENEQKNGIEGKDDRRIHYRDIAILLSGFKSKSADFIEELEAQGIPVQSSAEKDVLSSPEVLLTLCLLGAIDNPCRDVYLTGVMISPLFNFTADEIAVIRTQTSKHQPLYRSLLDYNQKHPDYQRGISFVKKLEEYRKISESLSIENFLYRLYRETGLFTVATEHGRQKNLLCLYEYARQFEQSSYRGLYAFISFLISLLENKKAFNFGDPTPEIEDKVQLMTIHKSKGLEFPVVFLSGASTDYFRETRDEGEKYLAYKADFGLALNLCDESGFVLVKNPVFTLINAETKRMKLEERLRNLYVALTRAKEKLIITGVVEDGDERKEKMDFKRATMDMETLYGINSYLDLIEITPAQAKTSTVVVCLPEEEIKQYTEGDEVSPTLEEICKEGKELDGKTYVYYAKKTEKTAPVGENEGKTPQKTTPPSEELTEEFVKRFQTKYENPELTKVPEKISVSYLYPGILDEDKDEDLSIEDASKRQRGSKGKAILPDFYTGKEHEDGKKRGIATHQFMQFCDFESLNRGTVQEELDRLCKMKFLSQEDVKRVHVDEVEKFKNSALLRDMLLAKDKYREFRFNVTLPAGDFTEDEDKKRALDGKEILVQGVIDCLLKTEDGEYVLIDYKTDRLSKEEIKNPALAEQTLMAKHKTQLTYYAKAIEKIFGKYPKKTLIYSLPLGDTVEVK